MLRALTVSVSMHELDRLKCIQAVVDGDLKPIRAADRLGLFRLRSVCGFLGSCPPMSSNLTLHYERKLYLLPDKTLNKH